MSSNNKKRGAGDLFTLILFAGLALYLYSLAGK